MKKFFSLLPFLFVAIVAFTITGCQKCYHCYNTCVLCTRTVAITADSSRTDSLLHCNDFYANAADYEATITNDTTAGYVCNQTNSTYQYDFCVNKPGDDQYPEYFDKGGRAKCDLK